MGNRVHVIKKHAEYGDTAGFNWSSEAFRSLLDATGADTCGEDYAEDFESEVENYQTSLKVVARLARLKRMMEQHGKDVYGDLDQVTALLEDSGEDVDDINALLEPIGGVQLVLEYMVAFYVERDRDSDWISFSTF